MDLATEHQKDTTYETKSPIAEKKGSLFIKNNKFSRKSELPAHVW
jgi:hypothetical protein